MTLSLIKNLLTINFWSLAVIGLPLSAWTAKYDFRLEFGARYGVHTKGSPTTATHRHTIELDQKAEFDRYWLGNFEFRAENESAYASVPERYGTGDLPRKESQSFLLRETYLQFQNGIFRARLGSQQVVWGETFGYYYADIVNAKDFREAGLGELSRNRLATPLLNLQWILSDSSLQLIYIPKAPYNLLPLTGSDFASSITHTAGSAPMIAIDQEPTDPPAKSEFGVRVTKQIASLDFSLFHFNYHDRSPVYKLQASSATFFSAVPQYFPLRTAGITMTADISGYLLRTEILQHFNREYNTVSTSGLSSEASNELVFVVGLDLPQENKWTIGLQYSESRLSNFPWLDRTQNQKILSGQITKTFNSGYTFETMLTGFTEESSKLVQMQLAIPISSTSELVLGTDQFDGSETSALGRFKEASRGWIMFRAKLKR